MTHPFDRYRAVNPASTDADAGVHRFLADLRTGAERRAWSERRTAERRVLGRDMSAERRSADRRCGADRRVMLFDRRRTVSDSFTDSHTDLIRHMLANRDADVACPRCGGGLLLGTPVPRGRASARQVHCVACRHGVVLTGLPAVLTSAGPHTAV
jgi:hypothetical protein